MSKTLIWVVVIAIVVIGGFVLFSGKPSAPEERGETTSPAVSFGKNDIHVSDQPADSHIVVSSVRLKNPGYVVIHEDANGAPGAVIGHSYLLEGERPGIGISLTQADRKGETLYAMLHTDDGDGIYEFPGDDVPIRDNDGNIILVKFSDAPYFVDHGVKVSVKESSFSPDVFSQFYGQRVYLTLTNEGRLPHNLIIEGLGIATKTIMPGETDTINFNAPTSSVGGFNPPSTKYTVYCSEPGHREAGEVGEFTFWSGLIVD